MNKDQGTTPETAEPNKFYFEMSIKTRGIVSSELVDIVELRDAITADFASVYGEGMFTIDELRPVSEDEVARLEEEAQQAYESLIADIESDEDQTIN